MSTKDSESNKKIFFTYNYENANFKKVFELNNVSNHYVGIGFFDAEIYDENNNVLGNVVYNYFIQEIKEYKFALRYDATFFIEGKGTISWKYDIIQKEPICFYSLEELIKARIVSSTGIYEDISGKVFLFADKVGNVFITIMFDEEKNDFQKTDQNDKIFENDKTHHTKKVFDHTKKVDQQFLNNSYQPCKFSLRKSKRWS